MAFSIIPNTKFTLTKKLEGKKPLRKQENKGTLKIKTNFWIFKNSKML